MSVIAPNIFLDDAHLLEQLCGISDLSKAVSTTRHIQTTLNLRYRPPVSGSVVKRSVRSEDEEEEEDSEEEEDVEDEGEGERRLAGVNRGDAVDLTRALHRRMHERALTETLLKEVEEDGFQERLKSSVACYDWSEAMRGWQQTEPFVRYALVGPGGGAGGRKRKKNQSPHQPQQQQRNYEGAVFVMPAVLPLESDSSFPPRPKVKKERPAPPEEEEDIDSPESPVEEDEDPKASTTSPRESPPLPRYMQDTYVSRYNRLQREREKDKDKEYKDRAIKLKQHYLAEEGGKGKGGEGAGIEEGKYRCDEGKYRYVPDMGENTREKIDSASENRSSTVGLTDSQDTDVTSLDSTDSERASMAALDADNSSRHATDVEDLSARETSGAEVPEDVKSVSVEVETKPLVKATKEKVFATEDRRGEMMTTSTTKKKKNQESPKKHKNLASSRQSSGSSASSSWKPRSLKARDSVIDCKRTRRSRTFSASTTDSDNIKEKSIKKRLMPTTVNLVSKHPPAETNIDEPERIERFEELKLWRVPDEETAPEASEIKTAPVTTERPKYPPSLISQSLKGPSSYVLEKLVPVLNREIERDLEARKKGGGASSVPKPPAKRLVFVTPRCSYDGDPVPNRPEGRLETLDVGGFAMARRGCAESFDGGLETLKGVGTKPLRLSHARLSLDAGDSKILNPLEKVTPGQRHRKENNLANMRNGISDRTALKIAASQPEFLAAIGASVGSTNGRKGKPEPLLPSPPDSAIFGQRKALSRPPLATFFNYATPIKNEEQIRTTARIPASLSASVPIALPVSKSRFNKLNGLQPSSLRPTLKPDEYERSSDFEVKGEVKRTLLYDVRRFEPPVDNDDSALPTEKDLLISSFGLLKAVPRRKYMDAFVSKRAMIKKRNNGDNQGDEGQEDFRTRDVVSMRNE